jgi:hypothetical protein
MMLRNGSRVLVLAAALWTAGAVAQSPPSASGLAADVAVIEARLARAESLRAIKRLQYAYGHYVEFGLWNDFADLFADSAVAHYPAGDLDRAAIRELFFEQVGGGQLGLAEGRLYPHFVLQPVVTLDPGGATAHGRWHVLTLLGGYGANATWVDGVYENDYVIEDGTWKLGELRTYTVFSGAYETGWTNPRTPPPADSGICENYLTNDCTIAFHYRPDRPGAPLGAQPEAVDVAASDLGSLTARLSAADRRIARLLDENAIINLQHAYGYYVDRKRWDDIAELFAADATLELGLRGVYRGQASIRRALDQFGPQGLASGELNDHLQLETIVTVAPDGMTANARGIDFALVGEEVDGEYGAEWREAVFENIYVNEGGIWKISAMHLYPRFATDYALGWARDARPAPVVSAAFPPDEPPTVRHGVYPDFYIPPFHFPNPVTGAPPQYPGESLPAAVPADSLVAPEELSLDVGEASSETLTAMLASSERRLERVIAYDAIENVANAYNFYLDEFDRDAADALFVADGTAAVFNIDVAGGRESILEAIESPRDNGVDGRPSGFMAIHQTLQPVIELASDGTNAKLWLRLLGSSGRIGEDGAWIAGVYVGEASLQNGGWKLSRMHLHLTWAADYAEGWASAAPYARIARVPLDFDNPGRP